MADILLTTQDFILTYAKVVGSTGSGLDIKNLIIEFNLYEDIFTNTISGDVLVNDSNDLLSFLALTGNDYISFLLEKPALECSIEKTYKIVSVSNRRLTNNTNESYILHFTAEEMVLSEQYRVSKSYKNKKVSEIVRDICDSYLNINTFKQINYNTLDIEETNNTLNLIVPNLKPLESLNWLSNYAQSKSSISPSTYLFYQNRNGFNFKSLQTLYETPTINSYYYEPKNLTMANSNYKDLAKDLTNVIAYEIINQFNMLDSISSGAYANKLISVDLINQSYINTLFDYDSYFKTSKHLNKSNLLTNAKNSKGDVANKTPEGVLRLTTSLNKQSINPYVLSKKQNIKDSQIEKFIPHRLSEMAMINTNRIRLVIPGDPLLTVGKTINFNLPVVGIKGSNGKMNDPYYSGKYLITAVRHKADQTGVFQSIIEICKESSPNAFENYKEWTQTALASLGI